MNWHYVRVFAVVVVVSLLCASAGWSAIGVYKWGASAAVPASVNYMLNTDANDTTGGWSVRIEIAPAAGGAAIKAWTFLYPETNCLKGMHNNAVIWDGTRQDGTPAPAGDYRAVVTAKAAAVTGSSLVPLWEANNFGSVQWMDAAVNMNPDSPYYGCVYAVNRGTKYVYMYDPDGSFVKTFPRPADGWTGSAPWGVAVASNGNVYATSFSWSFIVEYSPNGVLLNQINIGDSRWHQPRFIGARGEFSDLKMAVTYSTSNFVPTQSARLYTQTGQPPASPFSKIETVPVWHMMEPEIDAAGKVNVPVYADVGSAYGGALAKLDFATGAVEAQNNKMRRGCGLAITADDEYIWMSRYVSGTAPFTDTDSSALYKIKASTAYTTADPDAGIDVWKYGIANSAAEKRAFTIDCDGVGNLVATTGNTYLMGADASSAGLWFPDCPTVGLYAEPDSGSIDSRTTNVIYWPGDYQPQFNGSNGPVSISGCSAGATATVRVFASDLNGYLDIASCTLDRSAFGLGNAPMNRVSGSGNNATYELSISIPAGTAIGDYELPVYLRDVHYPTVSETVGSVMVKVTGGFITGKVTNSATGWPIPGVSATATSTADPNVTFSAVTDANGDYSIAVTPGSYTLNIDKGTGYTKTTDNSGIVVGCDATVNNVNRTLGPVDVRTCTGGNYRYEPGRPNDSPVCVTGIVMRTHYAEGVRQGLNGYYFIYDTSYQNTLQACKIRVFAGQTPLREGDKVVVDGTWTIPNGVYQGEIIPSRAPHIVSTGNTLPTASAFDGRQFNYTYGRLYRVSGKCLSVSPPNRFTMEAPTSDVDPTPVAVWIVADTAATTGVALPAVGERVDVIGVLSMIDPFGDQVLVAGKAGDISPWRLVYSLGDLKRLTDGGVILKLNDPAHPAEPLVVTYVDPGETGGSVGQFFWLESKNRTAGLKVVPGSYLPAELKAGDELVEAEGRLMMVGDAGRVLQMTQAPTVIHHYGDMGQIPAFLFSNVKAFGGGAFGTTPAVIQGVGANTDGLLLRVTGISSGYGSNDNYEWFYLDDGSGVPNEGGHTGIKVIRSLYVQDPMVWFPTEDGTLLTVEGICSSQWVNNVGRIRVLWMRYDPYLFGLSDQIIYR